MIDMSVGQNNGIDFLGIKGNSRFDHKTLRVFPDKVRNPGGVFFR